MDVYIYKESPRTRMILRLSLAINAIRTVEPAPQTLTVLSLSLTNAHDTSFGTAHALGGVLFCVEKLLGCYIICRE